MLKCTSFFLKQLLISECRCATIAQDYEIINQIEAYYEGYISTYNKTHFNKFEGVLVLRYQSVLDMCIVTRGQPYQYNTGYCKRVREIRPRFVYKGCGCRIFITMFSDIKQGCFQLTIETPCLYPCGPKWLVLAAIRPPFSGPLPL